jgi:threonine dehydrogenase-like Zn-dependent dehydrogenase
MLAVLFDGKTASLTERPKPRCAKGEALVAVRTAGVCGTDLEVLKGYMGFRGVMGHEFVGTVAEGPSQWVAKRVVAEINCVCGRCDMCTSGLSNHCRNRSVVGIDRRDGVFAEYVALPVANLHQVPGNLDDAAAVFVEPLAAAMQVLRQVKTEGAGGVVVIGDGRLGQLVARVLKSAGARCVLVGKHENKLEAAEKQGIETVLAGEFVPMAKADVVVEASGAAGGLELALRTVRPRGTIALKSTFAGAGPNLAPLVVNEVTVIGSRCGPFPDAIASLAAGKVDVSALVSRRFPLTNALEALDAAKRPENIKVLIDVQ